MLFTASATTKSLLIFKLQNLADGINAFARNDVTSSGSDTSFVNDLIARGDCKHESGLVLRSDEVSPGLLFVHLSKRNRASCQCVCIVNVNVCKHQRCDCQGYAVESM